MHRSLIVLRAYLEPLAARAPAPHAAARTAAVTAAGRSAVNEMLEQIGRHDRVEAARQKALSVELHGRNQRFDCSIVDEAGRARAAAAAKHSMPMVSTPGNRSLSQ